MHEKVDDKKGGEEGKGERKKNLLKNPKPTVGDFHRGGKAICSGAVFAVNVE